MTIPHTILDDLFQDIEATYPCFDRKKYFPAFMEHAHQNTENASQSDITGWTVCAYNFLVFAVELEAGIHGPSVWDASKDLFVVRSKGFLRFLTGHLIPFESMFMPFRLIMKDMGESTSFSILETPPGDLFKSASKNFEDLSRRMRLLDYARIIDRHFEIRQLIGNKDQCLLTVNPIDIAGDILTSKTAGLTRREANSLKRLVYNAARKHGILPGNYFVKNVERLTEHPIGGGSYGDVYKAKMGETFVAVKVSRFLWDPETKEKRYKELCKEALIWKPLDHPNVLPFLGICKDGFPSVGLVSPFMNNGDLLSFVRRHPKIDKIRIMEQICLGLDHLHSNEPEVIHGDLKCGNILVDMIGRPRIADFGLSRVVDVASLTASTGIKGTLRWQAPELVHPNRYGGDGRVNVKTDIYAFGMTCLEIFLEKTPFHDLNDWQVITMARDGSALERTIETTKECRWMQQILECTISSDSESRFRAEELSMNIFLSPLFLGLRTGST